MVVFKCIYRSIGLANSVNHLTTIYSVMRRYIKERLYKDLDLCNVLELWVAGAGPSDGLVKEFDLKKFRVSLRTPRTFYKVRWKDMCVRVAAYICHLTGSRASPIDVGLDTGFEAAMLAIAISLPLNLEYKAQLADAMISPPTRKRVFFFPALSWDDDKTKLIRNITKGQPAKSARVYRERASIFCSDEMVELYETDCLKTYLGGEPSWETISESAAPEVVQGRVDVTSYRVY